jgi:alpha-1,2-mannosyltransferase
VRNISARRSDVLHHVRGVTAYVATTVGVLLSLAFALYCAAHSIDFPVYYRAATQIIHGDYEIYPATVYDGGAVPPHGFRYAPVFAFLFAPLALVPLDVAAFLFIALKGATIVYIGDVASRFLGVPRRATLLIGISILLVAGYAVEEFRYGNFHFLCLALMVLAFESAEAGRVWLPASALALAIAAKLTPLLLLAHFAWRRRMAVCGATVVALLILLLAPALVVGFRENLHLLYGFVRYAMEKIDEGDNYSLRGVLLQAGMSPESASLVWLAAAVTSGVVVATALWRRPLNPKAQFFELSIVLTAMLLTSPHTQRRYFVWLYVPVLALVALLLNHRAPHERLARGALAVTVLAGTILPLGFGGRQLALDYESFSPYFFATAFLFVVLIVVTRRLNAGASAKQVTVDRTDASSRIPRAHVAPR